LRVFAYPFLPWKAVSPIHVVWQKSNETEFLLTMNFILFTNQGYPVAYPGILFGGGGGSKNSVEGRGQRERGSEGGSPLVRGSGGSYNLVQEISIHIVKFS
jgi:hypothetical protein